MLKNKQTISTTMWLVFLWSG